MSRYLFVVPPLAGHVNPTIGVAAALRRRGHQVAWAGSAGSLLGRDYRVYPCDVPRGEPERPAELRGLAALKFLWERFLIPLAAAMAPGVRAAVADFRPDAVIVDQQALAGAVVADECGLPWVTSSTTSAELTDPLASMPKVLDWIHEQLAGLRRDGGDPRFSPHLIIAFTTSALTGPVEALGDRVRFVGPSMAARPATGDFPWAWLDRPGPRVLVSLGTVNADAGVRFLRAAAQAVADRPALSAVVVDPGGVVGAAPENVLVRSRVPQLELLPRLDAVVCHAGHNTVSESLYHALPLVVAPIRDDQPVIAQQVVDAGVGVRIRFGRATDAHISAAVEEVLGNPSYRTAARRVQASFAAAGGAEAAADAVERLAIAPRSTPVG